MAIEPIDSNPSIGRLTHIFPLLKNALDKFKPTLVDSSADTIEKSKSVVAAIIDLSQFPRLEGPSNDLDITLAIETIDAAGRKKVEFTNEMSAQLAEVGLETAQAWSENLREIEEQVKQLLVSPEYLYIQQIHAKGLPNQSNSDSAAITPSSSIGIVSALKNTHWENISPHAQINQPAQSESAGAVVVLPLAISVIIGGGLGLSHTIPIEKIGSNPLTHAVDLLDKMQPLLSVKAADLVPLINLMIAVPMYYSSWRAAVDDLQNKGNRYYQQVAHSFAKDVIKMVTDPEFNILGMIRGMAEVEKLSPSEQDRVSTILKLVLIGVALSLMYTIEVGKVYGDQFGGMLPEELKELLKGNFVPQLDADGKLSEHAKLTLNLIQRAREQLAYLSPEDKEIAINLLFDYVDQSRQIDMMVQPRDVFKSALEGSDFARHLRSSINSQSI